MPSFQSLLAAATALASTACLVQAQYVINPDSVDQSTRDYWCQQQITQCPLICLQMPNVTVDATQANTCDATALAYACVCANGMSPNVTEYSQTLPYFVCTEWGSQCVAACGQDSTCATDCRVKHQCGAQSPTRVNTTAKDAASASATSADNGVVYTGLSGAASNPEASEGGASSNLLYLGQGYGGFVLASALVGGLALLL